MAVFDVAFLACALLLCSCATTTPTEGDELPGFPQIEFEPLD